MPRDITTMKFYRTSNPFESKKDGSWYKIVSGELLQAPAYKDGKEPTDDEYVPLDSKTAIKTEDKNFKTWAKFVAYIEKITGKKHGLEWLASDESADSSDGKSWNIIYHAGGSDEQIDETQIDELSAKLAWELFKEFKHEERPDDWFEVEEASADDDDYGAGGSIMGDGNNLSYFPTC